MKGKVILLNAPANAGKDTIAHSLVVATGASKREFKSILFDTAMALTGLGGYEFFEIYNDREKKELPHELFMGLSPRELMIWISEEMIKPKFGSDHIGVAASSGLDLENGSVFSDSGFASEVFPIAKKVGPENVLIVRFTRKGCSFDGDSRNWLEQEDVPKGVNFVDMSNNCTVSAFTSSLLLYMNIIWNI